MDTLSVAGAQSGTALCQDIHCGIYVDLDDERVASGPWEGVAGYDIHALTCVTSTATRESCRTTLRRLAKLVVR